MCSGSGRSSCWHWGRSGPAIIFAAGAERPRRRRRRSAPTSAASCRSCSPKTAGDVIWFVFAALTALVVALVIWPLAAAHDGRIPGRGAFDRAVYRDQLNEIARDVERGLLTPTEAASARLEIERRLLASDADADRRAQPAPRPTARGLTATLAVLVPLGALGLYLVHGSPR